MANPIKNFVSRLTTAFDAPVVGNNNVTTTPSPVLCSV